MYTGVLHTHALVTGLFVLLLLIFAFLLFAGKQEAVEKVDKSTKYLRIGLGVLILLTGAFLAFKSAENTSTWFFVKLGIVAVAIPLGIVGMKKQKAVLIFFSAVMFIYIYGVSETKSLVFKKAKDHVETVDEGDGSIEGFYITHCKMCHGEDGKLGLSGAKDLSESTLSDDEIREIIKNGKNSMQGYDKYFNDQQLDEMIAFVKGLRK